MPFLRPGWRLSVGTAAVLVLVALVAARLPGRRAAAVRAFAQEFTLVMLLLGLWQYVGRFVHTRVDGAVEHARWIAHLEAALGVPGELLVQRVVLDHAWLARAANTYYAYAHLNGTALVVLWLWWRHRDVYRWARTTLVASTLVCLLLQFVPVAPPRLLPELGFTDVALVYGQSVYGADGAGVANQLAAMPSVHVGWAVVVGWYVWRAAPRSTRWLGPLHTVLTVLVVVGTANHWWADGVVAAAAVAGCGGAAAGVRRWRDRHRQRELIVSKIRENQVID